MHRRAMILLLACLVSATALLQAAPATAPAADIEQAIRGLSAETWKERQQAQDKLVQLGPDAIAALEKLMRMTADDEVRTRAAAALRQINDNAQIGATLLTVKASGAKPPEVFAQISQQTGCVFPTYPKNLWQQQQNLPTITLEHERAEFWTVFRDACVKSGVFPQQFGQDRRMTLSRGVNGNWNGPSIIRGPFFIIANRINRSNSVDLANPNNIQRDFSVQFTVLVEPKIRVIQSSYHVKIEEALDDRGNSLVATDRVYDGMSAGNQWMWNMSARLTYPANAGNTIAKLRGAMRFLVQVKAETLDVPDILGVRKLAKTVAGRRLIIQQCKPNGQQYEVKATLYRDGMSDAEWVTMQNPGNSLRLLDKDGNMLTCQGWGGGGGADKVDYTWTFGRQSWGNDEKIGEPARLVWEVPTETRELNPSFEFKNLPLP